MAVSFQHYFREGESLSNYLTILAVGTGGCDICLDLLDLFPAECILPALQFNDLGQDVRKKLAAKLGARENDQQLVERMKDLAIGEERGAERDPIWARLLVTHFRQHFAAQIRMAHDKVTVSTPGGGWNSGTVAELNAMRNPGLGSDLWVACLSPEDHDVASERCNKIWALYKGLPAFTMSILMESKYIERLWLRNQLELILGEQATDVATWEMAVNRVVGKILVYLHLYLRTGSQTGDVKTLRYVWGRRVDRDPTRNRQIMYFVPLLVNGLPHQNPAGLIRSALDEERYLAEIDTSAGYGKGALVMVRAPAEYRKQHEGELPRQVCNLLKPRNLSSPRTDYEQNVKIQYVPSQDEKVEIFCLLAAPRLKVFKRLVTDTMWQDSIKNGWKDHLSEIFGSDGWTRVLSEAIRECQSHDHTDVKDIDQLKMNAGNAWNSIDSEFEQAVEWCRELATGPDEVRTGPRPFNPPVFGVPPQGPSGPAAPPQPSSAAPSSGAAPPTSAGGDGATPKSEPGEEPSFKADRLPF